MQGKKNSTDKVIMIIVIINNFVTKKLKELTAILGSFLNFYMNILCYWKTWVIHIYEYMYVCICLKIIDVLTITNAPHWVIKILINIRSINTVIFINYSKSLILKIIHIKLSLDW